MKQRTFIQYRVTADDCEKSFVSQKAAEFYLDELVEGGYEMVYMHEDTLDVFSDQIISTKCIQKSVAYYG